MILHQSLLGLHPLGRMRTLGQAALFLCFQKPPLLGCLPQPCQASVLPAQDIDVERTLLAEQPPVMPDDFTVQHHLGHKGNASVNK